MSDVVLPTPSPSADVAPAPLPERAFADSEGPMARWAKVLEAFTKQDRWGVRELATALSVAPSVSHRILHEMNRLGLVVPAQEEGKFRVGPELARIAVLTSRRSNNVASIARPVLQAAAGAIGETVILLQYSNHRRQFWAVDAVESKHTIRYVWESLQEWNDVHVGSSGKSILAFLPESEREAIIAALPDPIPAVIPMTKAQLREDLEETRARGYAVSHGERYAGAVGIAAPIYEAGGRIIGGLVASWPDNRTDPVKERRTAEIIVEAAAKLSHDLGYRPEDSGQGLGPASASVR
jgi:IclR family acetate operon transcriptional repressor